ncbi:primosomal protein N' [Agarivorans sp. MS3-6]|uniref:primosomal protein N' n=1 Tax=Agarivorans sp. TSD2052 TaxID=2937286 RepID=UPI0020107132|nr:primosomal protein N' [Agarivorans sp. TSD2052]UPW18874.1 primosomal protein N' [Agarivorans sp. TSD2052]
MSIVRVALAIPLRRLFDYSVPDNSPMPVIGSRVKVPFGKGEKVGLVVEHPDESDIALDKLKPFSETLDNQALLPESLFKLLNWASSYYHHSLGDVLNQALPSLLRKGDPAKPKTVVAWQLSEQGQQAELTRFSRAPKQGVIIGALQQQANYQLSDEQCKKSDFSRPALKALQEKGFITKLEVAPKVEDWTQQDTKKTQPLNLNAEQAIAVAAINQSLSSFQAFLIEGITGSGKTEVYLNVIAEVLAKGQQALVLVPEIGLTPQTLARFAERFNVPVYAIHSGLNDSERLNAWIKAKQGEAGIIIGTRSAVFTPMARPGVIIIDEEHDSSFKQQDSFRYHARDLAIVRARLEKIPIVLGSATPSLESLHNALSGRYSHLELKQRAGSASLAEQQLLDIRQQPLSSGLSPALIKAMRIELKAGRQVMLFLNRRGYAPALLCHECGHVCECERCEAYFTYHQQPRHLACHHCGSQRAVPHQCTQCGSTNLVTTGLGTEQLQEALLDIFPEYKVARIDRDSTRRKGSLEQLLNDIHANQYQILIGTQMLAKGHHFPNVTLVALLDIDHALFCSDFRAPERLAQLYVQVAGRAGRANLLGKVLLQSHHPEHELLQDLINNGYQHFARFALTERKDTELPPFSFQALFRFEAIDGNAVTELSQQLYQIAQPLQQGNTWVFPPMPAPQARRAGKYRMQLLIQAEHRPNLHQLVHQLLPQLESLKLSRKVRWSLDIDPYDMQ